MNTEYNANLALSLNDLCGQLNDINDQYPRRLGTMVMVSDDTENQIEGIVNQIDEIRTKLADLSDAEIAEITDDVAHFRAFLCELGIVIAANRDEINQARQFLSRYYAH